MVAEESEPSHQNGSTLAEQFIVTDDLTGARIPMRELTDAQIATYRIDVAQQVDVASNAVVTAIQNLSFLVRGQGALAYEADRRARSILLDRLS